MSRASSVWCVAILGLCAGVSSAHAAPVTETYLFTATGITPAAAPDPFQASVTITFDPATQNDGAVAAFSSNLSAAYGSQWSYVHTVSNGTPLITIGDQCMLTIYDCYTQTKNGWTPNTAYFNFTDPASGSPVTGYAEYVDASGTAHHSYSVTAVAVPEPGSLAVLATGLGVLGLAYRRRRT